jgi:hypothetical protein
MILARKQEAQDGSGVRMLSCGFRGGRAPDFLIPDVGVNLEHLVARHVQGLVNAMG